MAGSGKSWSCLIDWTEPGFNPNLQPHTHILPLHLFILTLTMPLHFSTLNHHHYLACKEVTLLNVLLVFSFGLTCQQKYITYTILHFLEQHSSSHCLTHTCATEAVPLLGMLAASPAVSDTTK